MVTATLICGVGDVAVLKADAAVEQRADIVTEAVVSQLFRPPTACLSYVFRLLI